MLVEHAQVAAALLEVVNVLDDWVRAIIWGELDLDLTWLGNDVVLASVLVTEGVSSNDDWLGPAWHESWDVRDNNWLSENGTVEDVSNGSVW